CYPVFSCVETRTMHNPTGSAQQVLPLLQSAKNPLRYLTPNDWALIIDRAKRLSFKKDEKLVSQGKQARTLYVLAAGKVSITVSATRIAQIGPVRFVVRWHFWKIASPAQQRRLKEKSRRTLSNGRSCRIYLSSFLISRRAFTAQSR